jgi:predicted RecB family nuclease
MSHHITITASMLYDFVKCPHRVTMDLFGAPAKQDPVSPFLQLLWQRGTSFEREVINSVTEPYLDLSGYAADEKEHRTMDAMAQRVPLIYGGRIRADDLVGEPDLLRLGEDGYVPGDIKSGSGEEEADEREGRPKKHYAVQLALYIDLLERLKLSGGRRGFIWDIRGAEVNYDLLSPQGARNPLTLWDEYLRCLALLRTILTSLGGTRPALGSVCKNCHWYSSCLSDVQDLDDLTLIPELGRSRRDSLLTKVQSVTEFSQTNVASFIQDKATIFPGIGIPRLQKFHRRACLLRAPNPQPQILEAIDLPIAAIELFFDVETDPFRDRCYLHGFVERRNDENGSERYMSFFADSPTDEEEEKAFAAAWAYIQSVQPCVSYYYSKIRAYELEKAPCPVFPRVC